MTNDERMQRESSLIATIRKNLPDLRKPARMTRNWYCSTKTLLLPTTKKTNTCSSVWRLSTQVFVGKKCA